MVRISRLSPGKSLKVNTLRNRFFYIILSPATNVPMRSHANDLSDLKIIIILYQQALFSSRDNHANSSSKWNGKISRRSKNYSGCYPTSCLTLHWFSLRRPIANYSKYRNREYFYSLHRGSRDSPSFLHFAWLIRDDREKRKTIQARLRPLVSSSRASNRGRTMQIVEEAFPKIAATFVGLSVAGLSLSCAYKSTSEHEHIIQVPWPIKAHNRNKLRETLQGLTFRRLIGGCVYVL